MVEDPRLFVGGGDRFDINQVRLLDFSACCELRFNRMLILNQCCGSGCELGFNRMLI
jgi:hypothetical protein